MDRKEIKNVVITLAEAIFRKKPEDNFDTLDLVEMYSMNSVDVLEFLLAIENELDFEFDDDCLMEKTLESGAILIDTIEKTLA